MLQHQAGATSTCMQDKNLSQKQNKKKNNNSESRNTKISQPPVTKEKTVKQNNQTPTKTKTKKRSRDANRRSRGSESDTGSSLSQSPIKVETPPVLNSPPEIVSKSRTPTPPYVVPEEPPLQSTPKHNTEEVREEAPNVTLVDEQTTKKIQFSKAYNELTLLAKNDTFLKVFVSEVVNPGLFYVHLVSPEVAKLDEMMEKLNVFYNNHG